MTLAFHKILNGLAANRKIIVSLLILGCSILAVTRLPENFRRLLYDPAAAPDLEMRYNEVQNWFNDHAVYEINGGSVYPPASYLMFWPITGWLSIPQTRALWAILMVLGLGWLLKIVVKEIKPLDRPEIVALVIIILAFNTTANTIGGGQLMLFVLPLMLAAIFWQGRSGLSWKEELGISIFFVLALIKPSISAPFFWIILFGKNGWRIGAMIVGLYAAATLGAEYYQSQNVPELVGHWLHKSSGTYTDGHNHALQWASFLHLEQWSYLISLSLLGLFGIWVYRNRHLNIWLLLGVGGVFARMWTYHRAYDDLLILLPIISCLYIAKLKTIHPNIRFLALTLLTISVFAMIVPEMLLQHLKFAENPLPVINNIVWSALLLFLLFFSQLNIEAGTQRVVDYRTKSA